ncbi:MAG: amidohydrolase [Pseudomonadales bacterium]|nr:amidohydrolase [Pseudomonadales bacterium]
MKRKSIDTGKHLVAALLLVFPAVLAAQEADLILNNGQIYTPSGWEKAVAVRRGVIVALGDDAAMTQFAGDDTQVVDLEGAAVLPGLHDLHAHPTAAGISQLQCNFPQGSTSEQLLAAVAGCAASHERGEWITGGQWDASSFGDQPMHRRMLDEVAPDNPVSLVDISGHSIWVNSRALELAGITQDSFNPPGGVIERTAAGDITGVLRESAAGLVRGIIPPDSPARAREALGWATQQMLSYGITSFTDALVTGVNMQAYADLADSGLLKQRVRTCMIWSGASLFGGNDDGMPVYVTQRNLYARDRVRPDCIKLVLDGVPTDGHTAAMVEPYADTQATGSNRDRGILMVEQARLETLVTRLDAMGFTVKMHAAGDGAVRAGLNAIAAARRANGFTGNLHNVAHNSFVQMDDIRRARSIAATFEMSPYIWFPNPIIPDVVKAVGEERMKRWVPVKDAIEAGALVVPGSDWPVVPNVNPWVGIETLVTRQAPGGIGEPLGEAEKITLDEAIAMFTVNAARQFGNSLKTGAIDIGMLADLIVLDRNPFDIPVTDIHNTKVLKAFIEGGLVYQAQ